MWNFASSNVSPVAPLQPQNNIVNNVIINNGSNSNNNINSIQYINPSLQEDEEEELEEILEDEDEIIEEEPEYVHQDVVANNNNSQSRLPATASWARRNEVEIPKQPVKLEQQNDKKQDKKKKDKKKKKKKGNSQKPAPVQPINSEVKPVQDALKNEQAPIVPAMAEEETPQAGEVQPISDSALVEQEDEPSADPVVQSLLHLNIEEDQKVNEGGFLLNFQNTAPAAPQVQQGSKWDQSLLLNSNRAPANDKSVRKTSRFQFVEEDDAQSQQESSNSNAQSQSQFSSQDLQQSFRALLPNVNINFASSFAEDTLDEPQQEVEQLSMWNTVQNNAQQQQQPPPQQPLFNVFNAFGFPNPMVAYSGFAPAPQPEPFDPYSEESLFASWSQASNQSAPQQKVQQQQQHVQQMYYAPNPYFSQQMLNPQMQQFFNIEQQAAQQPAQDDDDDQKVKKMPLSNNKQNKKAKSGKKKNEEDDQMHPQQVLPQQAPPVSQMQQQPNPYQQMMFSQQMQQPMYGQGWQAPNAYFNQYSNNVYMAKQSM